MVERFGLRCITAAPKTDFLGLPLYRTKASLPRYRSSGNGITWNCADFDRKSLCATYWFRVLRARCESRHVRPSLDPCETNPDCRSAYSRPIVTCLASGAKPGGSPQKCAKHRRAAQPHPPHTQRRLDRKRVAAPSYMRPRGRSTPGVDAVLELVPRCFKVRRHQQAEQPCTPSKPTFLFCGTSYHRSSCSFLHVCSTKVFEAQQRLEG